MDVEALKNELEHHLSRNTDEHAPHGFRDRFGILLEQYQAEEGDLPKAAIEAELQQIRAEAEAAGDCCERPGAEAAPRAEEAVDRPAPPSPEPVDRPAAAAPDQPAESAEPAEPGFMARYGLALIIIVVALGAAWYFFRR